MSSRGPASASLGFTKTAGFEGIWSYERLETVPDS
jgi:hypothetical protein